MKNKDIFITCENGTEILGTEVADAIQTILDLFPKYEKDYPIAVLGNWKSKKFKNLDGTLKPFESVDWQIQEAKKKARLDGKPDKIALEPLVASVLQDPYREKFPQWTVLIVKDDLYAKGVNFCLGYTQTDKFSIISVKRFIDDYTHKLKLNEFKTVVMHEFGHLINVTNENHPNVYNAMGPHCKDSMCVMQQRMNGDFSDVTRIRLELETEQAKMKNSDKIISAPFCPDCIKQGELFFQKQRDIQLLKLKNKFNGRI